MSSSISNTEKNHFRQLWKLVQFTCSHFFEKTMDCIYFLKECGCVPEQIVILFIYLWQLNCESDGLFCQRGQGSCLFAVIMYSVRVPWAWSKGSSRVTAGFRESDLSRFNYSRDSLCNREQNCARFICKYLFASLMENISIFSICRSCSETLFFYSDKI